MMEKYILLEHKTNYNANIKYLEIGEQQKSKSKNKSKDCNESQMKQREKTLDNNTQMKIIKKYGGGLYIIN